MWTQVIAGLLTAMLSVATFALGVWYGDMRGWHEVSGILTSLESWMRDQERINRALLTRLYSAPLTPSASEKRQRPERPWQARPDTSPTSPRERVPVTPAPIPVVSAAEPVAEGNAE